MPETIRKLGSDAASAKKAWRSSDDVKLSSGFSFGNVVFWIFIIILILGTIGAAFLAVQKAQPLGWPGLLLIAGISVIAFITLLMSTANMFAFACKLRL